MPNHPTGPDHYHYTLFRQQLVFQSIFGTDNSAAYNVIEVEGVDYLQVKLSLTLINNSLHFLSTLVSCVQYPPRWLFCIWGEQSCRGGTATGWSGGECQVGTPGVGYIAHAEMVDQLPAQVVLLLTLTLHRLQCFLQLRI